MVTPVKKVPIHLQSSQNRIIIKNGTVVNHDKEEQMDIYIEDGMIRMMGNHLIIPGGTRPIDATGKFVLPGGIDLNVHLQRPGYGTQTIDDFYQGTKAALMGGTTMVVDMVVPDKEESLLEAYDKWRRWADDKVCCDYALKMALPTISETIKQEMEELSSAEYGVNSFTCSMSGKEKMMNDPELIEALDTVAKIGGVAYMDAENGDIIQEGEKKMIGAGITGPEGHAMAHPEEAEVEAVMRACVLGGQVGCGVVLSSVTSSSAADIVSRRKSKGCVVEACVTPASLACDGSEYWDKSWRQAAGFVTSPPIRKDEKDNMMDTVAAGTVGVVTSHHAAYNSQQKALGKDDFRKIPAGITGVEERLLVLWQKGVQTGKISRSRFVEVSSSVPAKLLNIFPQKGCIAVGSDADIVIWDPNTSKTITKEEHLSKCDFNIFEGLEVTGGPEYVIFKGRMVTDQGLFRPMTGYGQYQALPPFPPFIFDQLKERREARTVAPVARSEEDMTNISITNGDDSIPPPTPVEDEPKPTNQHKSSVDLNSHPITPDYDETPRNSPSRSSVRVRAPPGGKSTGFW